MRPAHSILSRLITLVLAVAVPFTALLSYTLYLQFDAGRDRAFHELDLLRLVNERQLRGFLDTTHFKLDRLSRQPALQTASAEQIASLFREFVTLHPEYLNLAFVGPDGRVVAAANLRPSRPDTSLAANYPYRDALQSDHFFVSSPYRRTGLHEWSCLVSHPVFGADRRRIGTIVIPLNLTELSTQILSLPHGLASATVGLVDRSGTIVAFQPNGENLIGRDFPALPAIQQQLAAGRHDNLRYAGLDHQQRTLSAGVITDTPWLLFTSVSTAEILHDARVNFWRTLGGMLAVLIGSSILVWRYARNLARPVATLAAAARAQAAGRLDALAVVDGPAEIAATAQAFNEMVAARVRAEASLRASEKRFRVMADSAPVLIWTSTPTAELDFLNQSWLDFTGRSLAEELGSGWAEGIHPEDNARCLELYHRYFDRREPFAMEYRLRRHDGQYRLILDQGKPFHGPAGEFLGYIGVCVDLTDLRQAEQERQLLQKNIQETQKLESLGVLAGGIAHDFNNLLTSMLGYASLARLDVPDTSPVAQHLAQIERSALRAADLCKQMLAYAGKGRVLVQFLDLNQLIEETTQLFRISINKKTRLQFALAAEPVGIEADATQIRQLVMNLVINASEAIGDQTGTVVIRTGRVHADRDYLSRTHFARDLPAGSYSTLQVTDDGCGMDEATVARVFDPFFTTKFAGRGLGLAAVLGIVRGHHGAIEVESAPGRGTTFTVLFPAAREGVDSVPRAAPANENWRGAGTILVIDDEESVRMVLREILQSLGFTTVEAARGREGVDLFRRDPGQFTAVLLDLTMPEMDGEETFRQLRMIHAAVKVVLMSGFNQQEAVQRFVGKGLAGFVQKPFSIATLAIELRRVIPGVVV